MDEHHKDIRADCCITVRDRKMRFHDSSSLDPDWKLKQVVLLIVKGCCVAGKGVEQHWRTGLLAKGLEAADFGEHMEVNEFRAALAALPFLWTDKVCWCRDPRDTPWAVFTPFIDVWNDMQADIFEEFDLVLTDEEMVGWVPKTSELGGLPNHTLEPRKPKPLGTMLKNAAECTTSICTHTDPCMPPSVQDRKKFGTDKSFSPVDDGRNAPHAVHVAETLRQAHHCGVTRKGDLAWIGGDAWFGSVASASALKLQKVTYKDTDGNETEKPLNIESSFIIKNNSTLFPRRVLLAIPKARHGKKRAGHWAAMTTEIKGAKLTAVGCAWSNKDVVYLLSAMGDTGCCQEPHVHFDCNSGYDTMDTQSHPRPDTVDFLLRFLPKIDGSNKCRQDSIQLEEQWPAKSPWVKLFNAFIGKSVVNMKKLFDCKHPGIPEKELSTLDMARTIADGLKTRQRRPPVSLREHQVRDVKLQRITDEQGNTNKAVAPKQKGKRSTGSARQKTCYNCKNYPPCPKPSTKFPCTSWKCPQCGTALCDNKWEGRPFPTCLREHLNSDDPNVRCNGTTRV